jgi:hypothetical protein
VRRWKWEAKGASENFPDVVIMGEKIKLGGSIAPELAQFARCSVDGRTLLGQVSKGCHHGSILRKEMLIYAGPTVAILQ